VAGHIEAFALQVALLYHSDKTGEGYIREATVQPVMEQIRHCHTGVRECRLVVLLVVGEAQKQQERWDRQDQVQHPVGCR
jgi:hypothetical protein